MERAKPVYGTDFMLKVYNIDGDVRIKYNNQQDFERIAGMFGIFEEWKVIPLFFFPIVFVFVLLFILFCFDQLVCFGR